jgi:hypothetical protein
MMTASAYVLIIRTTFHYHFARSVFLLTELLDHYFKLFIKLQDPEPEDVDESKDGTTQVGRC